jgi:hypothetical protein
MSHEIGPALLPELLGGIVLLLVVQEVLEQIRHWLLPVVVVLLGTQISPVMISRSTRIETPGGKLFCTGAEIPPAATALSMNVRSC